MNPKSKRCHVCGHDSVVIMTGSGRQHPYHYGVELPVPDDFPILTCGTCGETYLSVEEAEQLYELQTKMANKVFDNFVSEQMKSPSFAEEYRKIGAQIAATDALMKANPGKPFPKFRIGYSVEIENGKKLTYLGQPVSLASNVNCGAVVDASWSNRWNQWTYSVYPWSTKLNGKRATEDVLLSMDEWVDLRLGEEIMKVIHSLNETVQSSQEKLSPTVMNIMSHYRALISGRANDIQKTIENLRKLILRYNSLSSNEDITV